MAMHIHNVSRYGDLIVMPAALDRPLTIMVRAAGFPPRIAVLQCDAALVGSVLRKTASHCPLNPQERRILDEVDTATAPIAEAAEKNDSTSDRQGSQVRVRLDELPQVGLSKDNADCTTLIVDADLADQPDDLVPRLGSLRRWFEAGQDKQHALHVFVRLRLREASAELVGFLLDHPEVTVVHVDRGERSPLEEMDDSRFSSTVAELAQTGLCVPVEVAVSAGALSSLRRRCEYWVAVNRGAGIIASCSPEEVDPIRFARTLIELHEASLIPSDRLAPVSAFIASLGGRCSTLPFPRRLAQDDAVEPQVTDPQCPWRGLRGHSCFSGKTIPKNWNCRVADVLYRHILSDLAAQITADAERARQSAGLRLRAAACQGKLVLTPEAVS